MGKYFGTDGFRGEANENLTVEHAYKVGRFLGWYYGKDHKAKVVIGKDTRRSSYMFEYSLVSRIVAMSFCEPRSWRDILSSKTAWPPTSVSWAGIMERTIRQRW